MSQFKGEFVETTTSDGLELLGLLAEPEEETETIIIHFHGMQGNFFQNNFVQEMLAEYPENNTAFLTVEQRGAEAVRYFEKNDGYVPIGNALEIFEESEHDIRAWIEFARELGYDNIYLQSHSLGTMKTAYYLARNDHNVSGTIFISPSDMWGLNTEDIEDREKLLEEAKELEEQGRENEIVTNDLWGWAYLSAKTFLNFFDEDTNTAIFNYHEPEKGFETVEKIDVPILAFLGTEDDGIVADPFESMNMLDEKSESCPEFEGFIFEGAEHSYEGYEEKIINHTVNFIDRD